MRSVKRKSKLKLNINFSLSGKKKRREKKFKESPGLSAPAMRADSGVNKTGHCLLPMQEFKVNSTNL